MTREDTDWGGEGAPPSVSSGQLKTKCIEELSHWPWSLIQSMETGDRLVPTCLSPTCQGHGTLFVCLCVCVCVCDSEFFVVFF